MTSASVTSAHLHTGRYAAASLTILSSVSTAMTSIPFYEVRNRYQLQSVHAWGTTCFKKEDVERVIGLYNEEQGKNISDDWYTCFDIMKLYGLGKTQVRRFAETHGVRIRKFKGGRANYYLKADWEAARKKAEKNSTSTKAKRK